MGTSFIAGKTPMIVSGSWWYGRMQTDIKTVRVQCTPRSARLKRVSSCGASDWSIDGPTP